MTSFVCGAEELAANLLPHCSHKAAKGLCKHLEQGLGGVANGACVSCLAMPHSEAL